MAQNRAVSSSITLPYQTPLAPHDSFKYRLRVLAGSHCHTLQPPRWPHVRPARILSRMCWNPCHLQAEEPSLNPLHGIHLFPLPLPPFLASPVSHTGSGCTWDSATSAYPTVPSVILFPSLGNTGGQDLSLSSGGPACAPL